jgi:uncharacterized protein (TIGR00730 family)
MKASLSRLLALLLALQPLSASAAQIASSVPQLPVTLALPTSPTLPPSGAALQLPAGAGAFSLPGAAQLAAPSLSLPSAATLPLSAVPMLPAQAAGLLLPGSGVPAAASPNGAAAALGVSDSLHAFAAGLDKAGPAGGEGSARLSGAFFDGQHPLGSDDSGASGTPKLPPGAKQVSVDEIKTPSDVDRLIPSGVNSQDLIVLLKRAVPRMAPYSVYTYQDAAGRKFVAIDISRHPGLIDNFPEQHSHEIALIKKIQLWNKDLQLVVREDGKTPDLVLGGTMTELKSLIGSHVDVPFLVNKANTQIYEHAQRHGLGHGAAVLDLTEKTSVPVAEIERQLNEWQARTDGEVLYTKTTLTFTAGRNAAVAEIKRQLERALAPKPGEPKVVQHRFYDSGRGHGAEFSLELTGLASNVNALAAKVGRQAAGSRTDRIRKSPVYLDRVFVFAGVELKAFVRQADGAYRAADPATMPLDARGTRRPASPKAVRAVQMLVKQGRLNEAERRLHDLEENPVGETHHPVAQARRGLEGERLLGRLSKLVGRARLDEALTAWQSFVKAHGEEARALEPRVREVLPLVDAPKTQAAPEAEPERFLRELEEPTKQLAAAGVEATVTVYGSARLEPGSRYYEEARKFGGFVARFGGGKIGVISGGGPGIMEAANRGAFEAGGPSIGYNIKLPHEQNPNPYLTKGLSYDFEYFATRKIHLRRSAMALVYFPGGFGTLDELFEVLTLMQTGKMPKVPIVLVGEKQHWGELLDFNHLVRQKLISQKDLDLFKFAETAADAWRIIAESRRAAAK